MYHLHSPWENNAWTKNRTLGTRNRMAARRLRCVTLTAWIALASAAARLPTEVARSACALARNDCSRKGRRPLRAGGGVFFFFCRQQLVEKTTWFASKNNIIKKDPGSLILECLFFFRSLSGRNDTFAGKDFTSTLDVSNFRFVFLKPESVRMFSSLSHEKKDWQGILKADILSVGFTGSLEGFRLSHATTTTF